MKPNQLPDKLSEILQGYTATGPFKPYCHFSKEADALTAYLRGDPHYSKRLTDHVTLLLSSQDDELVGCRVKGISGILRDLPNYVRVSHEGIELSVIFLPFRGEAADEETRHAINRLARAFSEHDVRLESCALE